ncbi:MAG: ABC transporter permease [Eubacteriales bacterium]
MSLLFFSIRNSFRKKAVAALAVLGVAFGCALMTFLFSVAAGMEKKMESTFNEVSGRVVVAGRDAIFGGMLLGMGTPPIPETYLDEVRAVPHVADVQRQVSVILRPEGASFMAPLYGYGDGDMAGPAGAPFRNIIEGSAPGGPYEVLIGKSLQEYMLLLNVSYAVGGAYRFIVPEANKPARVLELKVAGVYQTGNEVLDGGFSGAEKLAREIGKIQPGRISAINVRVDALENVEAAALGIEQKLAGKKPEVQVTVPRDLLIPLKNLLRTLDQFLLAVSLVAVAAGGLSILVVMLLSVVERRREFGILKALGWTPGDVVFMVLVESIFLSLLGAGLGISLGYAGLVFVKKYIALDVALFNWQVVVAVCASGVLVGVVGGLYPAWRANRSAPAEILRNS